MSLAASAATMLTGKMECGGKMGEGWATVKGKDGSLRWTYDGKPFYFYFTDKK